MGSFCAKHCIVLALLSMLILCGEAAALTRYSVPGKFVNVFPAFSVTYPKDWKQGSISPFVFEAVHSGGFPSIRILSFPDMGMRLENFSNLYCSLLSQTGSDVKIISDKRTKLKDGSAAREMELAWIFSGEKINTLYVTTIKRGIAVTVSLSDNKGRISNTLKAIAYSLKFTADEAVKPPIRPYRYTAPEQTDDGWPTAHLSEVKMDVARLADLVVKILNGTHRNIHSVLIFKNGKLVLEEYFSGYDFQTGRKDFDRHELHSVMSVSKSFASTLIGIAIDKGLIKGTDETLISLLPGYSRLLGRSDKKEINLHHALSMTAGFAWVDTEFYGASPDINSVMDYILDKPMKDAPGSTFTYNSGLSILLGKIILEKSAMTLEEFAGRYLFEPLGVKKFEWGSYIDRSGDVIPRTDAGLYLCPRDMARLGYLFIYKGKWNGKQIVSAGWIEKATRAHINLYTMGYGYQWWLYKFRTNDQIVDAYVAFGHGGQKIFVIPALELVVVFTAGKFSDSDSNVVNTMYSLMSDYIVSAVHPDSPKISGTKQQD